jgi:hypothetical protein
LISYIKIFIRIFIFTIILPSDLVSDSRVEDLVDIFPTSEVEDVVKYLTPTLQL